METQQALVKTEPDAIALVVHDGTGSNDCELQSSTSDPWSSISIAGCGDASIPASTVFENDVKTLVVMPSGTEDIVQTLAFQTLENSAAVSSGSIPLNILHSEPVSIDAVGESGIQIPVDCSASGASIKLEPVDPGYEETYPDTVQAPDISIVKTEDDSAIPTGLYKNVYIKPEPAGSSESSAATVSSAAAQEPVATTSVGNLESPLEVADRSFQRVKRCSVRLKRLPDGLLSRGIFRVPRVQAQQLELEAHEDLDVIFIKGPESMQYQALLHQDASSKPHSAEEHWRNSPVKAVKKAEDYVEKIIRSRSSLGPRPYKCLQCGKSYKTASGRWQHKKVHTGKKEHKCKVCGKMFMYKSSMTAHLRIHANIRPYPCPLCGQAFRWSSHMKMHLGRHTTERPFICDLCGKAFKQKDGLQAHINIHKDLRPHRCEDCGQAFRSNYALRLHQRRHTGERPYTCNLCSATFAHSTSLTVHLRAHTGERPYKCKLCPSRFSQSTHLRTHMRVHSDPQKELRRKKKQQKIDALIAKGMKPKPKPPKLKPRTSSVLKPDVVKFNPLTPRDTQAANKVCDVKPGQLKPCHSKPGTSQMSELKVVPVKLGTTLSKAGRCSLNSSTADSSVEQSVVQAPFTRKHKSRPSSTCTALNAPKPVSSTLSPDTPSQSASLPSPQELNSNLSSPKKPKADALSNKLTMDPLQPATSITGAASPTLQSLPLRVLMYRPLLFQSAQHKKSEQDDSPKAVSATSSSKFSKKGSEAGKDE